MVIAEKDGRRKEFSDVAWKLLGKSKNGWSQVSDTNESVSNEVTKENKTAPVKNQVVTNEVNVVNESEVKIDLETTPEVDEKNKEEFLKIVSENIKRNQIKDFLDGKNVKYKQNISNPDIAELLLKTLTGDIEKLKTTFKLS